MYYCVIVAFCQHVLNEHAMLCYVSGVTSFLLFFGFFIKATAYALERIFTQNTPKDVVPGKKVPFGGHDDYI